MMQTTFKRTRSTLLLYLLLGLFGYMMNAFGPIMPFLKGELNLSYTVSSLHFTAFAMGMILAGLGVPAIVARIGRWRVLWVGAFGMCLAELLLAAGHAPVVTIAAAFLLGLVGSLVPPVVSSALSDLYSGQRSIALTESNLVASAVIAAVPLLISWFSQSFFGWRTVLLIPWLAVLGLRFGFGKLEIPEAPKRSTGKTTARLSGLFWLYWVAIFFAETVEFGMISWCADYLEKAGGLARADAVAAVSVFMAGMILGRIVISRLLLRFTSPQLLMASVVITAFGFGVFWSLLVPWMAVAGLFLCGLGVAGLFPLILSLAIGASGASVDLATARIGLSAGIAFLILPLILGRIADQIGIRMAYGLLIFLLLALFIIVWVASRQQAAQSRAGSLARMEEG
jgi:fucose permease